jgi:putative ABC transport system permease protein
VFGLFPALQSARPQISQVMQVGTRRLAGSVKGRRIHTALIAAQIALTLLLMTAAGAAIQGFIHMMRVPLGYDPGHVMSVGIPLHDNTHTVWEERIRFFAQLREKIAGMPGVVAAGISTNATPPSSGFRTPVDILGRAASEAQEAQIEMVSPEYFTALRIPLLAGRLWNQSEIMRGATLVLVNEAFVRHYLSGGDALGHSVRIPELTSSPPNRLAAAGSDGWLQIIGVVADNLDDGLDKPVAPAVYAPYTLVTFLWTQILVRTQGEPLAMLHSIRQQIATIDPDQQTVGDVRDLQAWIQLEPEYARARLISMLFGAFSVLALTLAAVGLYSVVSYTVVQRTGELGIRVALGAQRRDVLHIVAVSAATSVGLGIVSGLLLSFGLNRLIVQWIENGTRDPIIILAASLVLAAVAILACLVPARRALSINPIEALRCE